MRRGEKGIVILAPITRRRRDVLTGDDTLDDTEQRAVTRVLGFRTTCVFDVLQTDGGTLAEPRARRGRRSRRHLAALEQAIADAGLQLTRVADLGGAHGCSRPGQIAVLESLMPADTASVLVHEFAHELMHQRSERPTSKNVRETEAEAVAFIVSTAIGVRPSVPSVDYIQLYAGNADTLRQSLQRIQATAR